jgi:hypothetical protein
MVRTPIELSKLANDAALHFLARRREYDFSDEVRQQLIQVVLGFTGRCEGHFAPSTKSSRLSPSGPSAGLLCRRYTVTAPVADRIAALYGPTLQ